MGASMPSRHDDTGRRSRFPCAHRHHHAVQHSQVTRLHGLDDRRGAADCRPRGTPRKRSRGLRHRHPLALHRSERADQRLHRPSGSDQQPIRHQLSDGPEPLKSASPGSIQRSRQKLWQFQLNQRAEILEASWTICAIRWNRSDSVSAPTGSQNGRPRPVRRKNRTVPSQEARTTRSRRTLSLLTRSRRRLRP